MSITVSYDYTLPEGDKVQFFDEDGLFLVGPGSPTATISGSLILKVDGAGTDASAIALNGSTNHAMVWNQASGLIKVVGLNKHAMGLAGSFYDDARFINDGRLLVVGANDGRGLTFGDQQGSCVNNGLIGVVAAGHQAVGVSGVVEMINSGVVHVSGRVATGFQLYSFSYLVNDGKIIVAGESVTTGVDIVGNLANSGVISVRGGAHASVGVVFHQQPGFNTFDNSGVITVTGDGRCVGVEIAQADLDRNAYTNEGVIRATIAFSAAPVVNTAIVGLGNTGKIIGRIELTNQNDSVSNAGKIAGDVRLLDGDDSYFTVRNGKLDGVVYGGGGDDLLVGGKSDERLFGDFHKADLNDGSDTIRGAGGSDTLTGGHGADVFIYEAVADSTVARPDLITDLSAHDTIDLSALDADATVDGDQAFHLVSTFSGAAGELTLTFVKAQHETLVAGDVDGDGQADITIALSGQHEDFAGFSL